MKNTALVFLSCMVLLGCSLSDDGARECLNGEGGLVLETRTLSGSFNAIDNRIPGNLFITQGAEASLTVEGQMNLLPYLTSEVSNEVLYLNFTECIETWLPFIVRVTVTDLEQVVLEGLGDIIFDNEIQVDDLSVAIVGQGNMDLLGTAENLEIILSGQGNARAFAMPSDTCLVDILGQGNVEVTVANVLDVGIDGQGNVFYKGNPDITSIIRGQGEIIDAN